MFRELYRTATKDGALVELYQSGSNFEIVVGGGGRIERNRYDASGIVAQLKRFEIPETVLQSGQ